MQRQGDEDGYVEMMDIWVGEISRLWDAIGKPLDADRLAIYQRELEVLPLGLLQKAISRVIRENTYSNVPPVGVIWRAVNAELDNPHDVLQAIDEWNNSMLKRITLRFDVAAETVP